MLSRTAFVPFVPYRQDSQLNRSVSEPDRKVISQTDTFSGFENRTTVKVENTNPLETRQNSTKSEQKTMYLRILVGPSWILSDCNNFEGQDLAELTAQYYLHSRVRNLTGRLCACQWYSKYETHFYSRFLVRRKKWGFILGRYRAT